VTVSSISVSFDDSIESLGLDDDNPVNIIKLANDVTHKRLKRCEIISAQFINFDTKPMVEFYRIETFAVDKFSD